MDLNYHHLEHFWLVTREGGVAAAARAAMVSQPTVSGSIRALERRIGETLFERRGRRLALTDVGRQVEEYARQIFTIGAELVTVLRQRPTGKPLRLAVGVSDALPKLVARRLIEPALQMPGVQVRLICREAPTTDLLAELATHRLDLVLADAPAAGGSTPTPAVRTFDHLLGECGVTFFAGQSLARSLRRGFPRSLNAAPVYLPAAGTTMRRELDRWFRQAGVEPQIAGEFSDSALLKTFGQLGQAAFPAPSLVADEVQAHYGVHVIGQASGLRERFYAVSAERRITHPAVAIICGTPIREEQRRGRQTRRKAVGTHR
jgi:LysR family transcriptional activator of nhaA